MDSRSSTTVSSFFDSEPSEYELVPRLPVASMSRLVQINRRCNALFKPVLDVRAAGQLLSYVLQGRAREARAMYRVNPRLLFIEATATEWASGFEKESDVPTHRRVQLSPLCAMVATGDAWMLRGALDVIAHYVDDVSHQSGSSLALEHILRQFPAGFAYPPSRYDFGLIANAITQDQPLAQIGMPSDATIAVIEKFRKDFMSDMPNMGYLFNLNELMNVIQVYRQNKSHWHPNQAEFFWIKVMGYLMRLVPAVFAQAMSQGLDKLLAGWPFKREMMFYNSLTNSTMPIFPLDSDVLCRLGVNFGIELRGCYGVKSGNQLLACDWITAFINETVKMLDECMRDLQRDPNQRQVKEKDSGSDFSWCI